MARMKGEGKEPALRLGFDRRIMLVRCDVGHSSDVGPLAFRELDVALDCAKSAVS